jgi:CRISPR-associated protein (TIGR03986 family)
MARQMREDAARAYQRRNRAPEQHATPPRPVQFQERYIKAPYNFVPLQSEVIASDSNGLGHDLPDPQGISGEIGIEIEAVTPLFIGGQVPKDQNSQNASSDFFTVNGKPTIPGSSLKGMFRNAMSIVTRSRIKVQNTPISVRDLKLGEYTEIMRNAEAGWLRYESEKSCFEIWPCKYYPVDHIDLVNVWPNFRPELTQAGKTVMSKSKSFEKYNDGQLKVYYRTESRDINTRNGPVQKTYAVPVNEKTPNRGYMVFTGQPVENARLNSPHVKQTEFLFETRLASKPLKVEKELFERVSAIHKVTSQRTDDSWEEYLRDKLKKSKDIPVFFIREGDKVKAFGFANMFRLLAEATPADYVPEAHQQFQAADFASALFGYSEKDQNSSAQKSMKSRVFFSAAPCVSGGKPVGERRLVLMSPRPTYYPSYLEQKVDRHNASILDEGAEYNTYLHKKNGCQIRGWKRYPVRRKEAASSPQNNQQNRDQNAEIIHRIRPIEVGSKFRGRIIFHNLTPVELGALLWVIDFGGIPDACHSLGGGKPYGYGVVKVRRSTDGTHIYPAANPEARLQPRDYVTEFENYIQQNTNVPFYSARDLAEFLDMATLPNGTPEQQNNLAAFLSYMSVEQFAKAKGSPTRDRHKRQVLMRYSEARKRFGLSSCRDKPYAPGDRPKL